VGHLVIDGHCVRALHAEQNALIQAALHGVSTAGATAYVTHQPCLTCAKLMINAGIRRIVYAGNYPDAISRDFLRQAGISLEHVNRRRSGDTVYQPSLLEADRANGEPDSPQAGADASNGVIPDEAGPDASAAAQPG
jgi:deoxycytidylate deaminase